MLADKVKEMEHENNLLKAQLKTLQEIYGSGAELPKNCEYCRNFIQHYIRSGTIYIPTCNGHCMAGNRVKKRTPGDTCKSFIQREYGKNFI